MENIEPLKIDTIYERLYIEYRPSTLKNENRICFIDIDEWDYDEEPGCINAGIWLDKEQLIQIISFLQKIVENSK
jgi:hypothetical protein